MRTLTATEVAELLGEDSTPKINTWLARGDGVAVYRNEDMSSGFLGHHKFASFGSPDAMFPTEPPQQLPDFAATDTSPAEINWRFQLFGVYRGDELPVQERDPNGPDYEAYWTTAIDNRNRQKVVGGVLEVWGERPAVPEEGRESRPRSLVILSDGETLTKPKDAVYLIDDGYKVLPWYVTGWNKEETRIFLQRFPTSFDDAREPIMRGDRNEQVSFDTWRLGPRRAYHLKVNKEI